MIQKKNDSLKQAVAIAWAEVNESHHHRLRILTRLEIYDRLINDMGVSIHSLTKEGKTHFPLQTPGLIRYLHLGIITVQPLFSAWEEEANRLETNARDMEPIRFFPYDMFDAVHQILEGKNQGEIKFKNDFWKDISNWHYIIGNLKEEIFYQHGMFLTAVHNVYLAAKGYLPIHPFRMPLSDQTYDENLIIPSMENRDFTYHALEATICEDPNDPDWGKPRPLPIKRDPDKALEFWRWWLFEAIPQAAKAGT